MGTSVIFFTLLKPEQQTILGEAEKAVLEFENKFSRFISDNELSKFNNSLETKIKVSDAMSALLKESYSYFVKTNGIFDPTIIGSLEKVGYDKNFADIELKTEGDKKSRINLEVIKSDFRARSKMGELEIKEREISRPENFRVDFGGIGKGYIVDEISRTIFSSVENFWISAGGDILAVGNQENGQGWDIGVQNPTKPEENIFTINTRGEKIGIASSGIIKRSGQTGDFKWNHIIDPRTGLPIENDILSVTVISSSAVRSDIFAKTVLILGEKEGINFIDNESDSAVIIFKKNNEHIFSKRANLYLKN